MNDKTLVLDKEVSELELARQHKLAYLFIKRTFDIFVGLIGILFLLPLAIIFGTDALIISLFVTTTDDMSPFSF